MALRVSKWLGCFRTCPGILGDKGDSGEEVALESDCVCRREPGEFGDLFFYELVV